jgi:hypothetical protein
VFSLTGHNNYANVIQVELAKIASIGVLNLHCYSEDRILDVCGDGPAGGKVRILLVTVSVAARDIAHRDVKRGDAIRIIGYLCFTNNIEPLVEDKALGQCGSDTSVQSICIVSMAWVKTGD